MYYGVLCALTVQLCLAVEHPIIEICGAVLEMYKHPEHVRHEDLIEAAKDFLYMLINVKEEVKNDNAGSLKLLKEIYLEGNPPLHLRNIPWGKLIEEYKWNDTHINEYLDIMTDTKSVWQECLAQLEKHKEPDEIL